MQNSQVLGHVLLGCSYRLLEFAHRRFAIAQAVEELDAHRLAKNPEPLRHELDQRLRKRMRNGA